MVRIERGEVGSANPLRIPTTLAGTEVALLGVMTLLIIASQNRPALNAEMEAVKSHWRRVSKMTWASSPVVVRRKLKGEIEEEVRDEEGDFLVRRKVPGESSTSISSIWMGSSMSSTVRARSRSLSALRRASWSSRETRFSLAISDSKTASDLTPPPGFPDERRMSLDWSRSSESSSSSLRRLRGALTTTTSFGVLGVLGGCSRWRGGALGAAFTTFLGATLGGILKKNQESKLERRKNQNNEKR